jgi:hypothetical protein
MKIRHYVIAIIGLLLSFQALKMFNYFKSKPDFEYKNLKNEIVNVDDVLNTKSTKIYFVLFSTDCEYCDDIAKKYNKAYVNDKKSKFVFITQESSLREIEKFIKRTGLKIDKNNLLIDNNKSFADDFGLGFSYTIPTVVLYDLETSKMKSLDYL